MDGDINMKKKRIALIIICTIILIIAIVVGWQFENIKSVYFYFKYSADDIDSMIQLSGKDVEEYLEKNTEIQVRPTEDVEEKLHQAGLLTDEELTMVIMGQTSVEELFGTGISINEKKRFVEVHSGEILTVEKLKKMKEETAMRNDSDPKNFETTDGTSNSPQASPHSKKEQGDDEKHTDTGTVGKTDPVQNNTSGADTTTESSQTAGMAQISQYVAQMYVLKSSFTGQLSGLYNQAISSYDALPSSQKNEAGKSSIIKELYPKAVALEASCDKQVATILKELEALLVKQGESTELVTKMKTAYYQEKSLVKAQYMNEL